jgi:RNase P protein component
MKRMVREVFRTMPERPAGVDIVVQLRRCPQPGARAVARAELGRLLEELAARPRSS